MLSDALSLALAVVLFASALHAAGPTTAPVLPDLPAWIPASKIQSAGCSGSAIPAEPPVLASPDAPIVKAAKQAEIQAAVDRAKPGQIIEIQPGTYSDFRLTIRSPIKGTAERPIILRGTDVTLTGSSHILVEAQFVIVQGLTFRDVFTPWGAPDAYFGVCIQLAGTNNRVTGCRFDNCGEAKSGWRHLVHLPNTTRYNRVDSCTFLRSQSIPTGLQDGVGPEGNVFSHNYIEGNNTDIEKNWCVGIQIGQGAHDPTGTVVEYNTIVNFTGPESIGIKGSKCTVRNNLVLYSKAPLGVRAGNDCIIRDNVMVGCAGGIMLTGSRHLVEGNCIIDTHEDVGPSPIFLHCEAEKNGVQFYMPTTDCIIRNNILAMIAPKPTTPAISHFCWLPDMKSIPARNTFDSNLIVAHGKSQVIGSWDQSPKKTTAEDFVSANTWTNNQFWIVDATSAEEINVPGGILGRDGNRAAPPVHVRD